MPSGAQRSREICDPLLCHPSLVPQVRVRLLDANLGRVRSGRVHRISSTHDLWRSTLTRTFVIPSEAEGSAARFSRKVRSFRRFSWRTSRNLGYRTNSTHLDAPAPRARKSIAHLFRGGKAFPTNLESLQRRHFASGLSESLPSHPFAKPAKGRATRRKFALLSTKSPAQAKEA